MPTCENCNNKWSWKQTFKKSFTLDNKMTCPYCGEKQYQTKKSNIKIGFLTPIVLLPLLIQIFFDVPVAILFSLFPVLFIVVMLLFPFLVELSSREDYINLFKDQE